MTRPRVVRQLVGSLIALALVATPAAVQAAQTPTLDVASAGGAFLRADVTSPKEAKRVDGYRVPKPDTFDCTAVIGVPSECGTVKLPLDYDRPTSSKTEVAYLRIPAKDQKNKIGTLFLNPGGPGGSGVDIASAAPDFLSPALLKKFDVVGMDPRGINFSDNVTPTRRSPDGRAVPLAAPPGRRLVALAAWLTGLAAGLAAWLTGLGPPAGRVLHVAGWHLVGRRACLARPGAALPGVLA